MACRETIKFRRTFDPEEANDSFRIATTDLSELTFLNGLVVEMVRSAPHIRVTTVPFRFEPMDRYFAEGTDVILLPSTYTSDRFASAVVMRMGFVCISSIDNPALSDGLTEEKLYSLPHASVSIAMPTGLHPTTVALETLFEHVHIAVRVNTVASLPQIVMGTDLISIVPRPFAKQWSAVAGIKIRELRDREECCGFGGMFSVKFPHISASMLEDKMARIKESGAEVVVANDCGCLMQIGGGLSRAGAKIETRHLAEVLASR